MPFPSESLPFPSESVPFRRERLPFPRERLPFRREREASASRISSSIQQGFSPGAFLSNRKFAFAGSLRPRVARIRDHNQLPKSMAEWRG